MAKLRITYKKSTIGYSKSQKQTVRSLGLYRLRQSVVLDDSNVTRGMVFAVRHLVEVEEVADDYVLPAKRVWPRPRIIPPDEQVGTSEPYAAPAVQAPAVTSTLVASTPTAEAATVVLSSDADDAATQALAPEVAAADAATQALAPEVAAADAAPDADDAQADDLEVIEGIGPRIAEVLRDGGIRTFAQLASSDRATIEGILRAQPNLSLSLASLDTWPAQAQLAAEGKWDEFRELTDRLKSGREA